jgi:hypothetical protein
MSTVSLGIFESPENTDMTPSKAEEMLALLWFILATQLHGWMRWTCVAAGVTCLAFAVLLAFRK